MTLLGPPPQGGGLLPQRRQGQGTSYQGPEPPGGPILGLKELGGMLANIIPGLFNLANEGVAQPLFSLIPGVGNALGLQDPATEFREAGQTGMDFANAITGSLLSTALLPLSPLEAAIGTDELADFLEFIPEEYRPRTPAQTFDQGLLPGLFEHVGNVAMAGGAAAKLGKAAGMAPTSRFMRGAQVARTPYRSTGRAAERIMRGQQFKVGGRIIEQPVGIRWNMARGADEDAKLTTYKPESQQLVYMSPDDYLSRIPEGRLNEETITDIENKLRAGTPIDAAFLDIDLDKQFKVTSQEGRHRANAAKRLGISQMPVILYGRRDGRFAALDDLERAGIIEAYGGVTEQAPLPIEQTMIGGLNIPAMPTVARFAEPLVGKLDAHRLKAFQRREVAAAHAETRAERAEFLREGHAGIEWLRKNLGHMVGKNKPFRTFRDLENMFMEEVHYQATVGEGAFNIGPDGRPLGPEGPSLGPDDGPLAEPPAPPPPPSPEEISRLHEQVKEARKAAKADPTPERLQEVERLTREMDEANELRRAAEPPRFAPEQTAEPLISPLKKTKKMDLVNEGFQTPHIEIRPQAHNEPRELRGRVMSEPDTGRTFVDVRGLPSQEELMQIARALDTLPGDRRLRILTTLDPAGDPGRESMFVVEAATPEAGEKVIAREAGGGRELGIKEGDEVEVVSFTKGEIDIGFDTEGLLDGTVRIRKPDTGSETDIPYRVFETWFRRPNVKQNLGERFLEVMEEHWNPSMYPETAAEIRLFELNRETTDAFHVRNKAIFEEAKKRFKDADETTIENMRIGQEALDDGDLFSFDEWIEQIILPALGEVSNLPPELKRLHMRAQRLQSETNEISMLRDFQSSGDYRNVLDWADSEWGPYLTPKDAPEPGKVRLYTVVKADEVAKIKARGFSPEHKFGMNPWSAHQMAGMPRPKPVTSQAADDLSQAFSLAPEELAQKTTVLELDIPREEVIRSLRQQLDHISRIEKIDYGFQLEDWSTEALMKLSDLEFYRKVKSLDWFHPEAATGAQPQITRAGFPKKTEILRGPRLKDHPATAPELMGRYLDDNPRYRELEDAWANDRITAEEFVRGSAELEDVPTAYKRLQLELRRAKRDLSAVRNLNEGIDAEARMQAYYDAVEKVHAEWREKSAKGGQPPPGQPPAPPSGGGQPPNLPGGAAGGDVPPPRDPTGLRGFVPAGHRRTLRSLPDEAREAVEGITADPFYQAEVLRMRQKVQEAGLLRAHRAATESPVGTLGLDLGKPGTYVTAKKAQVARLGRAMQKAFLASRARVEGVEGERNALLQMSREGHQAGEVFTATAQQLRDILPFQEILQADGTTKLVHRVNPIDPDNVPAYRPVERAEGFEQTDFEYLQIKPEDILTEKQNSRLGSYDVKETQFRDHLSKTQAEREILRAVPEDQLTEAQAAKLEDLDDAITELNAKLERNAKNREAFIKKIEDDKVVTVEKRHQAEMRAGIRNAVEKERASAKLREAKRRIEILEKRAAQEHARATKLRMDAEGPPEQFAQYQLGDRLQRQADKLLEMATRGQDFVDPNMVPPEWFEIARGQKELFNTLRGMSALAGKALSTAEIRNFMAENHLTWPAIVRRAAEEGFTPAHWRQFTTEHLDRWARESFRLSPSKIQIAGTRKARKGLVAPELVDRGFRSIVAAAGEISWEIHSNNIVDYLTRHGFVSNLDPVAIRSGTHIPYRLSTKELGNPEFAAFLEGTEVDAASTKYMISKSAAEALRSMNRSYDHAVWRGLAKFTDPWRTMALTYSPRWYVYNTIGNMLLTSAEIGPVNAYREWTKQWRKMSKEIGGFKGIFKPAFDKREISAEFQRLGLPQEVPGPDILEQGFFTRTMGEAIEEGRESKTYRRGVSALYNQPAVRTFNERLQRLNEVVDELSREAIKSYSMTKKGGALSAEKATRRAIDALVNYSDLSPFERTVIRSFVPFYAWQKGMLKAASKLAIDHPARVQLTIMVGRINAELWDEEKETLPEYYQGLVGLPGGRYLNTRGMNPFTDAPALLTPEGLASSMNPFIEIARKWVFRDEGIPFGPKEEGPFGYAQGRPSVGRELFRLGTGSLGGGILRDLGYPKPDQSSLPTLSDVPGAFGLRTFSPAEVAMFKQRQAAQSQQILAGLPLPPARRSGGGGGQQGGLLAPPGGAFSQRTSAFLGSPLLPVSTSALYRTR